ALAAPVATTLGARGIIPTQDRLSAGVAGSYSAPPANRIVHSAEHVLSIGCDTGDQVTLNWTIPAYETPIVQIEGDPLEIGRGYPNTTGIVGDPKATVARLVEIIGRPVRHSGFADEAARIVGDGGFSHHLAALESARRCGTAVTVIVNNTSGFGQTLTGVNRIAGNRPGRGEELIRFGPTDCTAVARSFGVRGIRVEQPSEIAPALREALAADETVVLDVVTDLEPRAPVPWTPPA